MAYFFRTMTFFFSEASLLPKMTFVLLSTSLKIEHSRQPGAHFMFRPCLTKTNVFYHAGPKKNKFRPSLTELGYFSTLKQHELSNLNLKFYAFWATSNDEFL